ncbi:MAG TPA: S1/P1 nuclease [Hanamia sp.]|nr:S1/P1 nuclease [Hanamia sp.]
MGIKGHAIVGEVAYHFLNDNARKNIEYYLDSMSIGDACNWMDNMRSEPDYNFMKPWHYINIPEGESYTPSTDDNIINQIIITFNELRHKKTLCDEQIKNDLLVLCHLIGDLHQPLHCGYGDDRGGKNIKEQYLTEKTNLHHVWDSNIIESENISADDCLNLYNKNPGQIDTIKGIHFVLWMKESRTLLNSVYDFTNSQIDKDYIQRSKLIIQRQLLIAGIRLAAVLNKLFGGDIPKIKSPLAGGQTVANPNNEIEASDAVNYIGQNVKVCSRVYGVKETAKIDFINLGATYPNSPLTIVIFQKDFYKFKESIENLYNGKNICLNGKIVEYKGKEEIIVTEPKEIVVL